MRITNAMFFPQVQERVNLVLISLVYYSYNIINIYLTTVYFCKGYITYFILFWSFFLVDKVISAFAIKWSKKQDILFLLFDIFQLGSFYICCSNKIQINYLGLYSFKLFILLVPQAISSSVLIFGSSGFISDDNYDVGKATFILMYLNFIILLISTGLVFSQFDSNLMKLQDVLNVLTSFLTQAALFGIKDTFGITVGYYLYPIIILILFYYHCKYKGEQFLRVILSFYLLSPLLIDDKNSIIPRRYIFLTYNLNQYIRFALLAVFGILYFINDLSISSLSTSQVIFLINWIISSLLGINQIYQSIKDVVKIQVNQKLGFIYNEKQLKKFEKSLSSKKSIFLQQIYLILKFEKASQVYDSYRPPVKVKEDKKILICISEKCQIYKKLYKKISSLKYQGVEILQYGFPITCFIHFDEMMRDIFMLPEMLSYQIEQQYRYNFQKEYLEEIMFGRICNGFSCSDIGINQAKILNNQNNNKKLSDLLNQMQSDYLHVLTFTLKISEMMLIMPSQILYDLYQ